MVSKDTSWIFTVTPYVSMAAMIIAALLVPVFVTRTLGFVGDLIVVVYLLGRCGSSWPWPLWTRAAPSAGWAPAGR